MTLRLSAPVKVHNPTAAFGGSALIRLSSAPVTLARRLRPPSSPDSPWSSITVVAEPAAGAVRALASVARTVSSPIESGVPSGAKSTTSLPFGLAPSARNPASARSASCSGWRMNRANSLAALSCS